MAFLEVIKHSRNILSITMTKEKGLWHKLGEIGTEILIIVFCDLVFAFFRTSARREQ